MSTIAHRTGPTVTGGGADPSTRVTKRPASIAPCGEQAPIRPSWRGWIHRIAACAFIPLSMLTVALAPSTGTRIAVLTYAIGVGAMLGVSAIYHSGHLAPATVRWFKRIDHTTILLGIAGSYTAIAVLALPTGPATTLVTFTWIAAAIGVAVRMVWLRAPYPVVAAVYLAVGWGALLEWNALFTALSAGQLALLLGGGLVYTAGAAVYALHRPNPWPATFGYHEVFHALVTAGVAAHYVVILGLVLQAR